MTVLPLSWERRIILRSLSRLAHSAFALPLGHWILALLVEALKLTDADRLWALGHCGHLSHLSSILHPQLVHTFFSNMPWPELKVHGTFLLPHLTDFVSHSLELQSLRICQRLEKLIFWTGHVCQFPMKGSVQYIAVRINSDGLTDYHSILNLPITSIHMTSFCLPSINIIKDEWELCKF